MPQIHLAGKNFILTKHAREKMFFYNLSESLVKRVWRYPERIEEGVAPNTVACMRTNGSKKHPYEIWVMYQPGPDTVKIISTWRYPGKSPVNGRVPVPDGLWEELGLA